MDSGHTNYNLQTSLHPGTYKLTNYPSKFLLSSATRHKGAVKSCIFLSSFFPTFPSLFILYVHTLFTFCVLCIKVNIVAFIGYIKYKSILSLMFQRRASTFYIVNHNNIKYNTNTTVVRYKL